MDAVTLEDVFSKLCEVSEELRQLSARLERVETAVTDAEQARDYDTMLSDHEAHRESVLKSERNCKCKICCERATT